MARRGRVEWKGAEVRRSVVDKAGRKLDKAAGIVKRETQTLLNTKGTGKRTEAGRRAKKWVALSKLGADDFFQIRQSKRVYKLGKGGKLRPVEMVWTGKKAKLRKGAKTFGAERAAKGEPPRRQTGRLWRSIRVTKRGRLTRRVGTHVFYGKILETKGWAFLVPALAKSQPALTTLFGSK